MKRRLHSLKSNLPSTFTRPLLWLHKPAEEKYMVLGGQHTTKALLLLGRTFKAKHMFDLSIKQYSDALSDLHAMDNTKKEVLYEKGLIHDEMGDKAHALECFKQIYEVDYGYRDVAQRVESSYQ